MQQIPVQVGCWTADVPRPGAVPSVRHFLTKDCAWDRTHGYCLSSCLHIEEALPCGGGVCGRGTRLGGGGVGLNGI